jgi:hypothetical protein
VRVSISPDNVASHRLASQYGFTEVGEQWDDEDGLEIIYEVDLRAGGVLPTRNRRRTGVSGGGRGD